MPSCAVFSYERHCTGYGFSLHLFHDSNFSEAPTGMCSILKKHEGSEIQIWFDGLNKSG
jgi:hypothetical protein